MIDVKDLMIGNYVINENSIFQLRLTDDSELVWHFVGSKDFHFTAKQAKGKMKPIPITHEWLIKLGFTRSHQDGEFDHKDNENVIILCENDGYTFDYECGGIEWCQCGVEYVHQLQNLFYLMTGEELTIGGWGMKHVSHYLPKALESLKTADLRALQIKSNPNNGRFNRVKGD